jgi:CP family cyanate transporter-like MFS transporter
VTSPLEMAHRPLFAGRVLAFVGIIAVAANMRTAVGGLSPLIPAISETYELTTFAIAILGSLAPLSFAIGGIITPRIERRINLERTLIVAIALMLVGHIIRASSPNWYVLALGTLLALLGMGIANVAMPPAVRKYFPDKVSTMTAVYMSVMSISAFIPPLIAVPVADVFSWRGSLIQWALLAIIGLIPWIAEYRKHKNDPISPVEDEAALATRTQPWRSKTAWAVGAVLAVSSVTGYAMYAWMPVILIETAGSTPAQAGALLALFAGMGLPLAFITPGLAARLKQHVHWLITLASVLFAGGYLGLLFLPEDGTLLWVALIGLGCLEFPLAMVLVNLRTENQQSSMALSGFAQIVAYMCAALAPPLMGWSHEITDSWSATLIGLLVFSVAVNIPASIHLRKNTTMDQDLRAYDSSQRSAR